MSKTQVRWLFCGSVGLRNFTSTMNLGYTINDLTEFGLDELTREEAIGLLSELCNSENINMNKEHINYTLDKLQWNIPYFIQVIFSKLAEVYRIETIMSYLPKTIRSLFIAIEILEKSHDCKNDLYFLSDYFYSYYQEKYDTSTIPVQRILSALAHVDNGLNLAEIREITKQNNGKISPYLKLMTDQKIIQKETKSLKNGIYSITDPLFKLWLKHNM